MGGPGFLGFRLRDQWLILAIWAAANWFRLDGRFLEDYHWEKQGRERPWADDPDTDVRALFVGWQVMSVDLQREFMTVEFDGGHVLRLDPEVEHRPMSDGEGYPYVLDDDLRSVVFLAPTTWLWIGWVDT
jgi:hypothetical protein